MAMSTFSLLAVLATLYFTGTYAQTTTVSSCSLSSVSTSVAAPSVAAGFDVRLVATGLSKPRGIAFDSAGHLLVVQQGVGIEALTLADGGGSCVGESSRKTVVDDSSLNHGIVLSFDGATLYASSTEAVYSYAYDPTNAANTSAGVTIINNMAGTDHTTRTLELSRFQNGTLLVTRGSTSNIDPEAEQLSSGHSQVKAFNLLDRTTTYDFDTAGQLLGWGLRNDVGIAEHPIFGGIYTVENSVDQMMRDGTDISENNPGEELNYLGTLVNNSSPNQGQNFGYPECFSAWNVTEIPDNSGITVGEQFAIGDQNSTVNDTMCQQDRVQSRLVFQAHQAPLDIKFNTAGTTAWITFHGSWDRSVPVGYKVSSVQFANGEPVAAVNESHTATIDIVSNQDPTACPTGCFRPVGLAWDSQGRLFFSSDATGEIYVITQSNSTSGSNGSVQSVTPIASATTTSVAASSGTGPTSTNTADTIAASPSTSVAAASPSTSFAAASPSTSVAAASPSTTGTAASTSTGVMAAITSTTGGVASPSSMATGVGMLVPAWTSLVIGLVCATLMGMVAISL